MIAIGGCSSTSPQQSPRGTSMVPYAADAFAEHGIRPDPDAPDPDLSTSGGIIVEWHAVDRSGDVGTVPAGYYLYRSDTSDFDGRPLNFKRIAQIPFSPAGGDTLYVDHGVRQKVRYSYAVTVYARSDASLESGRSDTVSFTLLERPVPTAPIGDVTLDTNVPPAFRFTTPGVVAIQVNEVRADNETVTIRNVWRYLGPVSDFANPSVGYQGDSLGKGKRYRWRVDRIIQGTPQANASRWVTFSVR